MTYIIDAVRTPIGNFGGTLKNIRTDDLAAIPIRELIKRTNIDPNKMIRGEKQLAMVLPSSTSFCYTQSAILLQQNFCLFELSQVKLFMLHEICFI